MDYNENNNNKEYRKLYRSRNRIPARERHKRGKSAEEIFHKRRKDRKMLQTMRKSMSGTLISMGFLRYNRSIFRAWRILPSALGNGE